MPSRAPLHASSDTDGGGDIPEPEGDRSALLHRDRPVTAHSGPAPPLHLTARLQTPPHIGTPRNPTRPASQRPAPTRPTSQAQPPRRPSETGHPATGRAPHLCPARSRGPGPATTTRRLGTGQRRLVRLSWVSAGPRVGCLQAHCSAHAGMTRTGRWLSQPPQTRLQAHCSAHAGMTRTGSRKTPTRTERLTHGHH